MMRQLFLWALLLVPCAVCANKQTENDWIEQVYRYAIADFGKSQEIMRKLKQQKTVKKYELNLIEGDIYFNRSDYFAALNLYKRALYDTQISGSMEWKKKLWMRVIPCYYHINDMKGVEHFASRLHEVSEKTNDYVYQAYALFYKGRAAHAQRDKKQAYRQMYGALDMVEKHKTLQRNAVLYSYMMTIVEYLQEDGMNHEQRAVMNSLEKFVQHAKDEKGNAIKLLTPQRQKDIYAHEAVLAYRMGKQEEARGFYEKFKTAGNNYQYDYRCIMPYLHDNQLFDDMIVFAQARIAYLEKISVKHTAEMTFVLRMLAEGYMGKGRFQEAAVNYQKLALLKREIIDQEETSSMKELTSVYELKETELKLKDQIEKERLIAIAVIAVVMVSSLVYINYRAACHSRKLKNKNRMMARMLDELLQDKWQLQAKRQLPEEKQVSADADRELFNRVWNELVENKLYLRSDLSRDALIQKYHIPKNKFSSIFTKYMGLSYSQCINNLRLEHAVYLFKKHPNYTIDSIAQECGMASTTLYRQFSQKYGMTPAEYREAECLNAKC